MWEERFSRMFGIIGYLSPHSQVTIRELAQEYEVSTKTIQRDLKVLEEAKLGVFYDGESIKMSRTGYKRVRSWMVG
ncbi:MAG: DeoR family transcriptional regulator [Candidatus Brocadiae bacterium]|nr:DeoR family transcriptional regulator [Candidatus Brocadiia bacterium]